MTKFIIVLFGMLFLGGCAELVATHQVPQGRIEPTVIFHPGDADYILTCVGELKNLTARDFKSSFDKAVASLKNGSDRDYLRFICLTLNKRANYKQLKKGMATLKEYIKRHPDNQDGLIGLLELLTRLDQVTVNHWRVKKKLNEKIKILQEQVEKLQSPEVVSQDKEKEKLRLQVEKLLGQIEQDNVRILELQRQIEQLKNIENIIKNRDH